MLVTLDRSKTEEEMFADSEHLIRFVIRQLPKQNTIETEDLYQEGAIALLTVIRKVKYDGLEIKSNSYIEQSIRKRICRYIHRQGTTLHVSRRLQGKAMRIGKDAMDELRFMATPVPIFDASIDGVVDSAAGEALASLQMEEVLKAVERLPQKKKEIMQEYFNCGMDANKTADKIGCHVATVYRARVFLRQKVQYLKIFEKDF